MNQLRMRRHGTCPPLVRVAPRRLYVDRMTDPSTGPVPQSADRALLHATNPAAGAGGAAEIARNVRDVLAPALTDEFATADDAARPPLDVVDIGANPIDGDAPYRLLMDAGLCRVTGFEPQPEALAELRRRAGSHERYLPYAVGDGGRHTLHLTATSGFASLLEPDERQLALLTDFPRLAQVTGRVHVDTRKLDAIEEIDRIDLLKIDIQGGELSVLREGRRKLGDALAVQTEVGFHRLYRDQPTFADVDLELRSQSFVPHQFVTTRTWPLAPVVWADPLQQASRQLVEADVLYVRDPVRLDELSAAQLARLALVADGGYGSFGLALRCVLELIARGVLNANAEDSYRALAAGRLPE
jgi:FkbM family methyltransferase